MKSTRLVVLLAWLAAAAYARPFTSVDLQLMERVGNPVVSPDGTMYVFNDRVWSMDTNVITNNMWYGSVKPGSGVKVLSNLSGVTDYAYCWTLDSQHVLFLSTRTGSTQLWGVSMHNSKPGVPYQISAFPVDIDNLKLSYDGKFAGFSALIYPGLDMQQTANKDAEIASSRLDQMTFDRLFIRRWDTWWLGKFQHLFYVGISYDSGKDQWALTGAPTDIMFDFSSDCPSRPFGGSEEFDFSYDSKEIAYTTQLGKDIAWSTDLNVYTYNMASQVTTCLTCDNPATDTQPLYSPNGKYIAYLSMKIPQYESDRLRLKLYDRSTKTISVLTESWDRSPGSLLWTADSTTIWSIVGEEARQRVYTIAIPSGTPKMVVADHTNMGVNLISCSDNPQQTCMLFAQQDLMHPTDIYQTLSNGTTVQMTFFNAERLSEIQFSTPIEVHYTGANGDDIMGWLYKPYGYVDGQKYPVVMYIHGGPEDAWFDEFHYRWNPQTITAAGYALFSPNPHGSSSFGFAFQEAILQNWGGWPFQDVMIGLDYLGATYNWINTDLAGAMGASYGGFLINWINSQTTKFKCLICHDGVFDPLSEYYQTDELYFDEIEFGYPPFVNSTFYDMWSPARYAANIVTPQLTFHGGQDFRISDVHGISAFTVLQRKGIPSILIRFPDENHWVQNPNNSIFWHDQVLSWFARWLK